MDKPSPAAPTPEEAQARIHRVEELAASNAPMDDLVAAVRAVHLGCTIKIVTAEAGKRFFRAVKMTEKPVVKSRVSYPPAQKASLGRANDEGHPVFYASFADSATPDGSGNLIACAFESRAKAGELFAVGEWVAVEDLILYPFGFQSPRVSAMARGTQPWIRQSEPVEAMKVINAWESKVFTRMVRPGEECEYRVGVALTKYALNMRDDFGFTDRISGIVFPAVATELNTDNVCLTPAAADNGLELLDVRMLEVKNLRLLEDGDECPETGAVGAAEVTIYDRSYPCNGKDEIKWPQTWIMRSTFTSF